MFSFAGKREPENHQRFRRAGPDGLRYPASTSCLGRHSCPADRGPNSSSLFPPQAAVVAVARKGLLAPFRPRRGCRNGKKLAAALRRVAAPSVCFAVACILLAAAPTAPPCFRHWRRSSLLPLVGEPLAKRHSFTECQSLPSVGEVALRSNDGEVNFPPKTPAAPSPSPPAHFRGG